MELDWNKLFNRQEELDAYIAKKHSIKEDESKFQAKVLALLVELGELANETRCFKFWSTKSRSKAATIVEEYVDGVHFILSLGLEKGYRFNSDSIGTSELAEIEQFNHVFKTCVHFSQQPTKENYDRLFISYLQLGQVLGFDESDIQIAYDEKNNINFERQNQGY